MQLRSFASPFPTMRQHILSKKNDPLSVDFYAFKVLICVHKHLSFTQAADELDVNQSAISYTIDKLRHVFDDPLFVREGRSLITTPRCLDVLDMAVRMSDDFLALTGPSTFDPAQTKERLVIACNYYERLLFVPEIVQNLKQKAPHLTLEIIDSSDSGHARLLAGEADILIGPFERNEAAFHTRTLLKEHYVCLMDKAHPMAKTPLTLNDYLLLDHVLVTYGGKWKSRYIKALDTMGHSPNIALKVPSPAGLESLITGSTFVATVPARLTHHIGPSLTTVPCPIPAPINIDLVWTARTHKSKMHIWVRDQINAAIRVYLAHS